MFKITFPFHGMVLNHRHGVQTDEGLTIQVRGTAPIRSQVKVNGQEAIRKGHEFVAAITLTNFETDIVATADGIDGAMRHSVRVVWDKYSYKRYRISIDDNVFFMRELYKDRPKFIADNLYLGHLKKLHDEFGAKFTLNLFYETPEKDFNLSMFPTDYKSQFEDNADWMRLTWHAYNEFPDRPYEHAESLQVAHDFDLLHSEVARFAGEKTWAPPTIVHWGGLKPSVLPTLAERGVKTLSGYFTPDDFGYYVNYGLDEIRCNFMQSHYGVKDFGSGITFSRISIVVNCTPIDQIIPTLKKTVEDNDTADYVDILTHEQYFWPYYFNYLPDHLQRMQTALRYITDLGYKPIFQHEGFMGIQQAD